MKKFKQILNSLKRRKHLCYFVICSKIVFSVFFMLWISQDKSILTLHRKRYLKESTLKMEGNRKPCYDESQLDFFTKQRLKEQRWKDIQISGNIFFL